MAYQVIGEGAVGVLCVVAESEKWGLDHQTHIALPGEKFRASKEEAGDEPVLSPVVIAQLENPEDRIHKLLAEVGEEAVKPARGRPKKTEETEKAAV
jgi:hypothetical protein